MKTTSWAHAKDVIVEALRLPADERESFVRGRIVDPDLRAEILEMIIGADSADGLMKTLEESFPTAGGDRAFDDLDDRFEELAPGTRIGKYVVLQLIGRGGMGQVYLANDPQLHRKVALKCLASSGAAPTTRRTQILHEARAAARVEHTNVAIIHDVLEDTGRAFIVMEFVAGESLATRLKRERMPIDHVVSIGLQLTSALAAAHAKGVVHRDLKPSNVQFTTDGAAKVLDFGIANAAREATTAPTAASTITRGPSGPIGPLWLMRAGTPAYMSPEQLLGREVDQRSDLYSLGLILFEMATGRRMYPSGDPLEIAALHAKGAPRADAIDSSVPRRLADIVEKALEPDVVRRYQSAAELEAALQLVTRAKSGAPVSRGELIRLWLGRIAVGVPLMVAIIVALGWLKTLGFNYAFGRIGPFARFGAEPWPDYIRWGLRGNIARLVVVGGFVVLATGAGTLIRVLELIGPVGRTLQRVRRAGRGFAERTDLIHPGTAAQALAAFGALLIIGIGLLHADLLQASTASFNSAPLAILMPMSEQTSERNNYQNELTLVLGLMGFSLYKIQRMRKRERTGEGRSGVAALVGVSAIAIMMSDLPYRTFRYRDFERADLAGRHCYITGETSDEVLVLCPGDTPPRSRIVKKNGDDSLKRLGTLENIFRGFPSTR